MHTLHFCTIPTVQECKECKGVIPKLDKMKSSFYFGVPLYPLQWSTTLRPSCRVQFHPCCRARKLPPSGKFLSSLGNFPSRIVRDNAENVPNEPKWSAPLRTPAPMSAEPSLLGLCRVQPGEDRRSTPQRLIGKPYTAIAPQHKTARQ